MDECLKYWVRLAAFAMGAGIRNVVGI
jgi:hypothetical protein